MRAWKDGQVFPHETSMGCLNDVYQHGLRNRGQFIAIRDALKVRSQIVHGLVPPPLDPESARFVVSVARHLPPPTETTASTA